jgi:hypothetical protein
VDWDAAKRRAFCTCTKPSSIFDVVCKMKEVSFEAAKIIVAEMIGRADLIRRTRGKGGERGRFPHDNDATLQHFAGCTVAAYATAKHLGVEALSSFGISESYYLSKPAGCWLLQSGQIGVGHGLKAEIPRVHPVTDTIGDNNVAQNPEGLHVSLRLL